MRRHELQHGERGYITGERERKREREQMAVTSTAARGDRGYITGEREEERERADGSYISCSTRGPRGRGGAILERWGGGVRS